MAAVTVAGVGVDCLVSSRFVGPHAHADAQAFLRPATPRPGSPSGRTGRCSRGSRSKIRWPGGRQRPARRGSVQRETQADRLLVG
jgi:hypothetical protein